MTEYQKEMAFLKRAIRMEDSERCRTLEERITHVQRESRCVERAVLMIVVPLALTAAAFAYGAVLEDNFPFSSHQLVISVLYVTGLSSLISLTAFSGLWLVYRQKLNQLREECRQLVASCLEGQNARQGQSGDSAAQLDPVASFSTSRAA